MSVEGYLGIHHCQEGWMRQRGCQSCKTKFKPQRIGQRVCSPECAVAKVRADGLKAREAAYKSRKKALLENDRSFHVKQAQTAFNKFIRERDIGKPCISCGRHHAGQYHAGHYRTTAAQPALRFNELNCHKQCAPCNNHKSGNITEYRIELVKRVGESIVEWLEIDHKQPSKWTIPELKAIRKYYQEAVKQIQTDPLAEQPF